MVPSGYHAFFGSCADVAGTLIGLLFAAISLSPGKDTGRQAPLGLQVQAAVAFTTLIDALVVALAGARAPAPCSSAPVRSPPQRQHPSPARLHAR
jgi:hypothetical protein